MSDSERLGRRLLKRLEGGARLVRRGEAWFVEGARGPRILWPAALVSSLLARGLLRQDGEGLVRDASGAFAEQHRVLDTRLIKDKGGRDCYVVVNAAESPLALLSRRGLVGAVAFEAGEKLRRDFTLAQLSPRMGVDYASPVGRSSHKPDIAETALAARQRFNRAIEAAGPGLSDLLFDICCYLKGLDESEKARGWPRGAARIVLLIALDRLAGHYGMTAKPSGRLRSWSMEDG